MTQQHPHTCPGCGQTHVVVVEVELGPLVGILDRMNIKLRRMESLMATEAEQINTLSGKFDTLIADVRTALKAIGGPDNTLGVDGQAAFDALSAKVDAFDAEVTVPAAPVEPPVL